MISVTPYQASQYALINSILFVAIFYLTPKTFRNLGRDHPHVIRYRLLCTFIVSILSTIHLYYSLSYFKYFKNDQSLWSQVGDLVKLMGFQSINLNFTLKPFYLTVVIYLGNLIELYFMHQLPFQSQFYWKHDFVDVIFSWNGFRNYIWGPLIEEVVFRSCNATLFQFTNMSTLSIVLITSFYFGLAHIHHSYELYRKGESINRIILITTFQFSFTALFGCYCSFGLLSTKSVIGPILSHIFCNVMGLPTLPDMTLSKRQRQMIIATQILSVVFFSVNLIYF